MTHSNIYKSQIFFIVFVLSVGLHRANYLIAVKYGLDAQALFGFSLLYFPLIFLFASLYYSPSSPPTERGSLTKKRVSIAVIIFIYTHVLLIYGLINQNNLTYVFYEYWMALAIFFSYKLATNIKIWNLYSGSLNFVYYLFSLIVWLGIPVLREHLEDEKYFKAQSDPTASLAYEMAPLLDFWPFLFIIGLYNQKKVIKILSFLPPIIYLAFQLYFLKRAPSARVVLQVFFVLFLYQINTKNVFRRIRLMLILILISIALFTAVPDDLLERFRSQDTSRMEESLEMFEQLTFFEHLIGRGLGSGFIISDAFMTDYVGSDNYNYKTTTHIGAFYPYLKGGIVFVLLIFLEMILAIKTAFQALNKLSVFEQASLGYLFIYILFRMIEGPPTTGSIFDGILLGMSLGCLDNLRYYVISPIPSYSPSPYPGLPSLVRS